MEEGIRLRKVFTGVTFMQYCDYRDDQGMV